MAESQKVTVVEDAGGKVTVTAKPAELMDVVTTAVSADSAVTGMYGFGQKVALVVAGMAVQSKLKTNSFNFLK
jgi:surfactin synthase thioesterase subunit